MIRLRPYQEEALERLRARLRAGSKRPILVAPTGSGKTTIAAEMARLCLLKGKHVLFVAHRKELIDQAHERFVQDFVLRSGVIMGDDRRFDGEARVQVGSVETLVRRRPLNPPPDLIILDECHRAVASSYQRVLEPYAAATVIGLTATPFRLDGKGLGEVFDAIEVLVTPAGLVASGHLVPPEIWAEVNPRLDDVHRRAGDFVQEELQTVAMASLGDVVASWEKHGAGLTLAFAVSVAHSQALVELLRGRGHAAEHVDADTVKSVRTAIWKRLRGGETRIVSNVGIATEGFDCPAVECVLLARPTASLGLYLQMVGRGLRPFGGKDRAVIVDCGGNVVRHGWPLRDLSGEYSLESMLPSAKWSKQGSPTVRRCNGCFAVFEASKGWPCPICGWKPKAKPLRTAETGTQMRQLEEDASMGAPTEAMRRFWVGLEIARQRKRKKDGTPYAPGWSLAVYRGKYGCWPPRSWRETTA